MNPRETIAANVAAIRERIAAAAARSGRRADEVRLVAVTKYVGTAEIEALLETGCRDLGESQPQSLWQRAAEIQTPDLRWHFIGHLQRNKVRRTLPLVSLVHSADSPRLLAELDAEAKRIGRVLPVLLEVNISGDAAKHGLRPEAIEPLWGELAAYANLSVRGLMGMAALEGGLDTARRNFGDLRALRDRLRPTAPAGVSLDELSMGMSGDFEVAIEAGATLVRIGSSLFEGLPG